MLTFRPHDDQFAPQHAAVVEHLARYRLGIMASFRQLPAFAERSSGRIRKILRVLQRDALIASSWLHHGRRYWHLTEQGAARSHLPAGRSGSLSEQAKLRAYAILRFCCLSGHPRQRLTSDEMRVFFPDLYRTGMPQGYYFDPRGNGRMGLIRIDAGLRGRWDRVVQSVRDDLRQHLQHSGFRRLIIAGHFDFTIVTVLPHKAERIRVSLARMPDVRRTSIQVLAVPELLPLIVSASGKEVLTA